MKETFIYSSAEMYLKTQEKAGAPTVLMVQEFFEGGVEMD